MREKERESREIELLISDIPIDTQLKIPLPGCTNPTGTSDFCQADGIQLHMSKMGV